MSCPKHHEGGCPTLLNRHPRVPDTNYGRAYIRLHDFKKETAGDLRKALVVALEAMRDYSGCFAPCEMIHE